MISLINKYNIVVVVKTRSYYVNLCRMKKNIFMLFTIHVLYMNYCWFSLLLWCICSIVQSFPSISCILYAKIMLKYCNFMWQFFVICSMLRINLDWILKKYCHKKFKTICRYNFKSIYWIMHIIYYKLFHEGISFINCKGQMSDFLIIFAKIETYFNQFWF